MDKPIMLADAEGIRYLESAPVRTAAEKGFSLIEVLFAAGLISFLLAGTAELLLTSIQIDRNAERAVSLAGVLSSQIEEFKARPFSAPELEPGAGEIVLRPDSEGPAVLVAWSVTDVFENLKKVSFNLTREGAAGRPSEAILLITRDLDGR